jgi:hypothetical protein
MIAVKEINVRASGRRRKTDNKFLIKLCNVFTHDDFEIRIRRIFPAGTGEDDFADRPPFIQQVIFQLMIVFDVNQVCIIGGHDQFATASANGVGNANAEPLLPQFDLP